MSPLEAQTLSVDDKLIINAPERIDEGKVIWVRNKVIGVLWDSGQEEVYDKLRGVSNISRLNAYV